MAGAIVGCDTRGDNLYPSRIRRGRGTLTALRPRQPLSMRYRCLGASRNISLWRRLINTSKWSSTSRPRILRSVAVGSVNPANSPRTRSGPPSSRRNSSTVVTTTNAPSPPIPLRVSPGGALVAGSCNRASSVALKTVRSAPLSIRKSSVTGWPLNPNTCTRTMDGSCHAIIAHLPLTGD
jgi:hypothetical protein